MGSNPTPSAKQWFGVIELLKMSITGLVGVIFGYLAGREKKYMGD